MKDDKLIELFSGLNIIWIDLIRNGRYVDFEVCTSVLDIFQWPLNEAAKHLYKCQTKALISWLNLDMEATRLPSAFHSTTRRNKKEPWNNSFGYCCKLRRRHVVCLSFLCSSFFLFFILFLFLFLLLPPPPPPVLPSCRCLFGLYVHLRRRSINGAYSPTLISDSFTILTIFSVVSNRSSSLPSTEDFYQVLS